MLTARMSVLFFAVMILRPRFLVFLFVFIYLLVVELDLPWDDRQVQTLGEAFKAWGEADFEAAISAIKDALPFSQLAFVVLVLCLAYFFRSITMPLRPRLSDRSFRRTVRLSTISFYIKSVRSILNLRL
jgi:hypothetical protein